jgi:hypothetical protein
VEYVKPEVVDYGDLFELTAGACSVGSEDGTGKTIQIGIGGIGDISVGIIC